jgi:hypothetical protein
MAINGTFTGIVTALGGFIGADGETVNAGPPGIQGNPGNDSTVPGPPGKDGTDGSDGLRGSLWHSGSGAPGTIGGALFLDQYLNTATGEVYSLGSDNVTWAMTGNIRGLQGVPGAAGAPGSLVLVSSQTVSGTPSELDFLGVFTGAYDNYKIEIVGLLATTAGDSLLFQWGNSSGPTWATDQNYYGAVSLLRNGGVGYTLSDNDATFITIFSQWDNSVFNVARPGDASFTINHPLDSSLNQVVYGNLSYSTANGGNFVVGGTLFGTYFNDLAADSFRLIMSGGTLTSGTVRVYGITP